jgi:hypothetical protein
MSTSRPTKPPAVLPRSKPPQSNPWPIIIGVGVFLLIAVIVAGRNFFSSEPKPTTAEQANEIAQKVMDEIADSAPPKNPLASTEPPVAVSPVIDDDGKTFWVSPTEGQPLDLSYLSPGAQMIVSLRPAALLKNAEGEKVVAALGPAGQQAIETVERTTSVPLAGMDRLVIGFQMTGESQWLATYVVHALEPITRESILAKQSGATEQEYAGKKFWLAGGAAYYFPSEANKVLVVAPPEAMQDVIDLAGHTPPLRRDIERLIDHTDRDRQVTIVLAPNSLFGEGQSIFAGQMSRLRGPLFWFLGDELSGAALSLNWDDNFFMELIATPKLETPPESASRIFAERVSQIPGKLEEYVVSLSAQPYSRMVVSRFPEMLRKLAAYTRSDFAKDYAMLRCYLPAVAGHNLLLAAELTLSESPTATPAPVAAAPPVAPTTNAAAGVQQRLAKVTSLKFARDTLESALDQLSQDIGAPIVIRGADLQADGITKNQSFGIDLANKPAEQILVEILRLANPDKTATGPNDKRQKLVYVIETKPDKTEQIVVTTRAKAAERRSELPAAFRSQ